MPTYKWGSPQDWLGDRINARHAVIDDYILRGKGTADDADKAVADLVIIANGIVNGGLSVVADSIQDYWQDVMEKEGYFRDTSIIPNLTREQCVSLLEAAGIQCYDTETVETLREAVESNVEDGTIAWSDVEEAAL